jgi:hypothetical protein
MGATVTILGINNMAFQVVTWGQPLDDGGELELYEVIVEGRLIRADSFELLKEALREFPRPRLRLVA